MEESEDRDLLAYILCEIDQPVKSLETLFTIIQKAKEKNVPFSYQIIKDNQGYSACTKLDHDLKLLEEEGLVKKDVILDDNTWEIWVYKIRIPQSTREFLIKQLRQRLGESMSNNVKRAVNSPEIRSIMRVSE